jgi:hypothetical protein
MGEIIAATPRMRRLFAILDPMTLPTAIPGDSWKAATRLVSS